MSCDDKCEDHTLAVCKCQVARLSENEPRGRKEYFCSFLLAGSPCPGFRLWARGIRDFHGIGPFVIRALAAEHNMPPQSP